MLLVNGGLPGGFPREGPFQSISSSGGRRNGELSPMGNLVCCLRASCPGGVLGDGRSSVLRPALDAGYIINVMV